MKYQQNTQSFQPITLIIETQEEKIFLENAISNQYDLILESEFHFTEKETKFIKNLYNKLYGIKEL